MSTDLKKTDPVAEWAKESLSLAELTRLLVEHYGHHAGKFDLMLQYDVGSGAVGPDKENQGPGVMIGLRRVGLVPSTQAGPTTVDASVVNPAKKARRKG